MPNDLKSASSRGKTGLATRLQEAVALAAMHVAKRRDDQGFDEVVGDIAEYEGIARTYCGKDLRDLKILEIGYGARPLRLFWLSSLGYDVTGVDLDAPVIGLDLGAILRSARVNGAERAVKSLAREVLAGDSEWRGIARRFAELNPGKQYRIDRQALQVGDAAQAEFWRRLGPVDFIYSEDVFEHIPAEAIPRLLALMSAALNPNGIAFIRPHIFTGIAGGHHVEWYPNHVGDPVDGKAVPPWGHLRGSEDANTYLNKAGIEDYEAWFARDFDILDRSPKNFGLGREHLTPAVQAELDGYSTDELMTNQLGYVLRAKAG